MIYFPDWAIAEAVLAGLGTSLLVTVPVLAVGLAYRIVQIFR